MATVNMGINYETQVYFDLETNSIVKTIPYKVWDLAFQTGKDGRHVFLNGARNMFVYNTHETDPLKVDGSYQSAIKDTSYLFDSPSGLPDSTAIGEWYTAGNVTKNEVYIINIKSTKTFKKIVIKEVTENSYILEYGDLADTKLKTITIPKDDQYNYTFFSFDNGGTIVSSEPPKDTWDIVFTYYLHVFYSLNTPYLVSGVLLNSYNTTAFLDSASGYDNVTYNLVSNKTFSNHRDAIGYNWKDVKINVENNTAEYTTRPDKVYVIRDRKNQYWKLHFLGFYDDNGVKGSPSFEFEQIQ